MSSTGHPTEEGILMKSCFFSYRIQEASCLKALILLGGFNHPDTYWKSNTANCKQSRRLLECTEDSFLAEVIENPSKGDTLLDLLLTNAEKLTRGIKTGDTLGFGEHALVEFSVSMDSGWAEYKIKDTKSQKGKLLAV